jgi:hypothetical protein
VFIHHGQDPPPTFTVGVEEELELIDAWGVWGAGGFGAASRFGLAFAKVLLIAGDTLAFEFDFELLIRGLRVTFLVLGFAATFVFARPEPTFEVDRLELFVVVFLIALPIFFFVKCVCFWLQVKTNKEIRGKTKRIHGNFGVFAFFFIFEIKKDIIFKK